MAADVILMQSEITIRQLHTGEVSHAAAVIRLSFRTVADAFGLTQQNCPTNGAFLTDDDLLAQMEAGTRLLGIHAHDKLVGVVGIRVANHREYYMEKLAVLPEYRHLGYGAQLVGFACEQIRQCGVRTVAIGIIDENTVLKGWYEQQGFIVTGIERFPQLPFTVCFMKKELA